MQTSVLGKKEKRERGGEVAIVLISKIRWRNNSIIVIEICFEALKTKAGFLQLFEAGHHYPLLDLSSSLDSSFLQYRT